MSTHFQSWLLTLALAAAAACGGSTDTPPAGAPLGSTCSVGNDCDTGLCVAISDGRAACTARCESDGDCPAPWSCASPSGFDGSVCRCTPTADVEICDDGLDNDCDGKVDDCMMCDGEAVAPSDPAHCGACGNACREDQVCAEGACVCANGSPDPSCPPVAECMTGADCEDGIACTEDFCSLGRCFHSVVPARCGADEVCDLRNGGCRQGRACAADADCEDMDPCTTDERCDPSTKVCLWLPLDGDLDGDPPRVCGGSDCDDDDTTTRAGSPELCDGIDNDCDGEVDSPLAEVACGEGMLCDTGACACEADRTICGRACPDLSSDPAHCGACDHACPADTECVQGVCECGDELTACGQTCVDTQEDEFHCGACGQLCPQGHECVEGACVDVNECEQELITCPEHAECVNDVGRAYCACVEGYGGSECTNVNECESVEWPCNVNANCADTEGSYTCTCSDGFEGDGFECTDIDECETVDCGEHGSCRSTAGGYTCDCDLGYAYDGEQDCVLEDECQAGLLEGHLWCNDVCADIRVNDSHCGGCNMPCAGDGVCAAESCGCEAGAETYCAGRGCFNTNSATEACGNCDTQCPQGAGCVGGTCLCPADSLPDVCDDACVDTQTDENHCGACGEECAQGATCVAGECECAEGQEVCDGACRTTQTDENHCGACGTPCAQGATCTDGECACGEGEIVCDGTCVDSLENEDHCGICGETCDVTCSAAECSTVVQVEAGNYFTCARLSNGRVYCWGEGASYRTGLGTTADTRSPSSLDLEGVTDLALSVDHACAIAAGALYCWGENVIYQAGAPSTGNQTRPYEVASAGDVELVATGDGHTCVQSTSGELSCFGSLSMLGHGNASTGATPTPQTVTGLSDVDQLVAGYRHTCALKAGEVYCWGANSHGQLGTGDRVNVYEPVKVPSLQNIRSISAGSHSTCAIRANRTVVCWGGNGQGQLGRGSTGTNGLSPVEIAGLSAAATVTTGNHTCVTFNNDDPPVCMGDNTYGQLGDGSQSDTAWADAYPEQADDFSGFAHGIRHTCAIDATGALHCWGSNGSGATGHGALSGNTLTPQRVSF